MTRMNKSKNPPRKPWESLISRFEFRNHQPGQEASAGLSGFLLFQVQNIFQPDLHLVNGVGSPVHDSTLYYALWHAAAFDVLGGKLIGADILLELFLRCVISTHGCVNSRNNPHYATNNPRMKQYSSRKRPLILLAFRHGICLKGD